MLKRLFMIFLAGRIFRMISGRRRGYSGGHAFSRDSGGWGSRHHSGSGLPGLFGGRRRQKSWF